MNTAAIARAIARDDAPEAREVALQLFLELDPIRAGHCVLHAEHITGYGGMALINEAAAYRSNSKYWRTIQRIKQLNRKADQCDLFSPQQQR